MSVCLYGNTRYAFSTWERPFAGHRVIVFGFYFADHRPKIEVGTFRSPRRKASQCHARRMSRIATAAPISSPMRDAEERVQTSPAPITSPVHAGWQEKPRRGRLTAAQKTAAPRGSPESYRHGTNNGRTCGRPNINHPHMRRRRLHTASVNGQSITKRREGQCTDIRSSVCLSVGPSVCRSRHMLPEQRRGCREARRLPPAWVPCDTGAVSPDPDGVHFRPRGRHTAAERQRLVGCQYVPLASGRCRHRRARGRTAPPRSMPIRLAPASNLTLRFVGHLYGKTAATKMHQK